MFFKMITNKNESNGWTRHRSYLNVMLMVEKVIQIKSGTTINAYMSAKIKENTCAIKIVFGI